MDIYIATYGPAGSVVGDFCTYASFRLESDAEAMAREWMRENPSQYPWTDDIEQAAKWGHVVKAWSNDTQTVWLEKLPVL